MAFVLGSGEFRYEVTEGWGKLPGDWTFHEVAAVAVDGKDQVYCFTRGKHPVIVFDRDGNFLRSWGDGVFKRAHGATIGPDDTVFLTDDGDHTVRKCTPAGKVLLTLGVPGKPSEYFSGDPFHRCTEVFVGRPARGINTRRTVQRFDLRGRRREVGGGDPDGAAR